MKEKLNLSGKVAIVTGASKGIGKSIASAMGQFGAKVVISSRKQENVESAVQELQSADIEIVGIPAHMGEEEQIRALVDQTIDIHGQIDIVVNNAAINPVFGPISNTDGKVFDKIFQVNVKGALELSKMVYPLMKENGSGSIINISSIEGVTPGTGLGLYSVSKSALITLTKVMAREWGKENIRVNAICPGLVKTKFSEALTSNEQILKMVLAKQALPQLATPDDIAGLAVYLASDAGSFTTGGVFMVDGGYTI